jgi:catalase
VGGERGSADTERDPRGFAVRFYTEEGNWDLVGNNTPVFFIKDGIKFPDFIHTQKRDPQTNLKSPTAMFDFWSRTPESLHQVTTLFSSRGTPDGYRHMHGFGSHTYSLINAAGERVYVKWHFLTQQGIKNLSADEATRIAGTDPDYAQRDLFNAIARGDFPRWDVKCRWPPTPNWPHGKQRTGWNPFDLTKVWPHADFPLLQVGVLELNRNPVNYHAEVEQAALSPSNVVPGMGYSPDKMLQARLFAYHDAQLYRVGTNHQHLPVNAPRCPFHNQQRDGAMAAPTVARRRTTTVQAQGSNPHGMGHGEPPLALDGAAGRYDGRGKEDDYTQAGNLFRLMPADEQQNLFDNIAGPLSQVSAEIIARQLAHFDQADAAYGAGVRAALKHAASTWPKGDGSRHEVHYNLMLQCTVEV